MKVVNQEIKKILEGIIQTDMSSSSLQEKIAHYFYNNPQDISILKSNIHYLETLLKKGDEFIHAVYEYCYKEDKQNEYLKKYSSTPLEGIEIQNLKTAKKSFKSDEDNSGIFNYKVFVISNEVFTDNSTEGDISQVSIMGSE